LYIRRLGRLNGLPRVCRNCCAEVYAQQEAWVEKSCSELTVNYFGFGRRTAKQQNGGLNLGLGGSAVMLVPNHLAFPIAKI